MMLMMIIIIIINHHHDYNHHHVLGSWSLLTVSEEQYLYVHTLKYITVCESL